MPAVWLSWSLILFAACILSFVWRTGSSTSPPSTGTFEALSPRGAVGVRIAITSVFFLGMIYFVLIKTLRKYGTRMDQKWKQKVMEWIAEDTMAAGLTSRPTRHFVHRSVMVPRTAPVHTAASAPATRSSTSSDTPTGSHSSRVSIHVTSPPLSGARSPMIPHGSDTQIADTPSSNTDLHNRFIPLRNVTEIPVDETGGANTVNTIDPMRLLQAPLAFFRSPIRLPLQIHFDTIRIAELNPLTLATIEMPYMLGDHDVYREDWITFVNDLSLVWRGRFPVAGMTLDAGIRERVHIAAHLVNQWNNKFFLARQVEIVLCMEQPKTGSSKTWRFALYLTEPGRRSKLKAKSSIQQLTPTVSWANSIPPDVRDVVPLTGRYTKGGISQAAAARRTSVELPSSVAVEEVMGQHRRVNSMP